MTKRRRSVPWLILCIALPLVIGLASFLISGDIKAAYLQLKAPPGSPPAWLFGVVWPILYIMMGLAIYFIQDSNLANSLKRTANVLFLIQLLLNFIWSPVFFRMGNFWLAVAVIILLDIAVMACTVYYWRLNKLSGILFAVYLIWILFATYLNIAFAIIN